MSNRVPWSGKAKQGFPSSRCRNYAGDGKAWGFLSWKGCKYFILGRFHSLFHSTLSVCLCVCVVLRLIGLYEGQFLFLSWRNMCKNEGKMRQVCLVRLMDGEIKVKDQLKCACIWLSVCGGCTYGNREAVGQCSAWEPNYFFRPSSWMTVFNVECVLCGWTHTGHSLYYYDASKVYFFFVCVR